ncbi:MAG TPA: hypothetical protein VIL85_11990 [Thermomicrobiales bacterium]
MLSIDNASLTLFRRQRIVGIDRLFEFAEETGARSGGVRPGIVAGVPRGSTEPPAAGHFLGVEGDDTGD